MADYITTATTQIVNLLLANTYFANTVRPGNISKNLSGIRWPEKPKKASGDLPSFTISTARNDVLNANVMRTFSNVKSGLGDRNVYKDVHFQMVIVWDSLDYVAPNQLMSVLEGILLQNPTLGITSTPIQSSGKFTCRYTEERSDTTSKTLRLVQRIDFPVIFLLNQAALVAQSQFTGA